MIEHARPLLARTIVALLCASAGAPSQGTEPLRDRYTAGGLRGKIEPAECCWLKLPPSQRLQEIRRAEIGSCSALGGPVGMFEYRDGKLWLARLSRCGGVIELNEVYPAMDGPVVADWLSGKFRATLYQECRDKDGVRFVTVSQALVVDRGAVVSLDEERSDTAPCTPLERDPA